MSEVPSYPRRPKFFAHRFTRLLGKTCIGAEIGPDACWLLVYIAHTEDAAGYARPVTFFNEDLATRLGMSVSAMRRARGRAVGAGWLAYVEGKKRRAPTYFVTVPEWATGKDDAPGDEYFGELEVAAVPVIPRQIDATTATCATENRQATATCATENRQDCGQPSSLSLSLPLSLSQDPPTPAGEPGEAPTPPNPAEVVAAWNAQAGLIPCQSSSVHRERAIRQWAFRAEWVKHWRGVIEFMGRTAFYVGGGSGGWRATIDWLFEKDNFSKVLDQHLAPPAPAAAPRAADRKQAEIDAAFAEDEYKRKAG
jgi:hypothetical protein